MIEPIDNRKTIPFKTGMIYRSKTHPHYDMIIDFVQYEFGEDCRHSNLYNCVCWCNINRVEFMKFVESKQGKNRETTYPYCFYGECSPKSIRQRIKKYNLEYVGTSDDKVQIYRNDELEYCSGFVDKHSKLAD